MKYLKYLRSNIIISKFLISIFNPINNFAIFLNKIIPQYIRPNGVSVSYLGIQLKFPKNIGGAILNSIFWKSNDYEYEIGNLIKIFSPNNKVFIDVGSNIGIFGVFAKKNNPDLVVHCIEPVPDLATKIELFSLQNNVNDINIHKVAMSDKEGISKIFIPSFDEFNETTTASLNNDFFYNRNKKGIYHEIKTLTLDKFKEKHIDIYQNPSLFLKIDVEGHEIEVLNGASKLILTYQPFIIIELEQSEINIDNFFAMKFLENYFVYRIIQNNLCLIIKDDCTLTNSAENFLLVPKTKIKGNRNLIKIIDFDSLIIK